MFSLLGAKIAAEQRGRLQRQGLSNPIPGGDLAAVIARRRRGNKKATRPWAKLPPQLYSESSVSGILSGHVTGRRRYMGGAGATRTVSRLRPLGHFSLTPLASPRAGPARRARIWPSPSHQPKRAAADW